MDFLDIASRYAQNRFDNATQPFTDPGGYAENRLGIGGETEEERRRRLEREARERAAAEAVPVTQTVKTNPVTGEQEMTIKGSPHDLSAANPLTPTVTGPVVPNQAQPQVQPIEQPTLPPVLSTPPPTMTQPRPPIPQLSPDHQAAIDQVLPPAGGGQPQAMPVAQPAPVARPPAVTFSDIPGQEVNNGYPTMPRLQGQAPAPAPSPSPVPAPVAPMAMPVAAPPPVAAQGPVNPAAPPPAMPMAAPVEQAGPPTSAMSSGGWQDRITTAKTGQDYRQIMSDPNTPEPIAQLAAGRYAESLKQSKEEKIANDIVDRVGTDPKAANDLTRALKKNTEEGSYIKAVLFARLGLNELAKEEQQKLGAGSQFQSIIGPDGTRYTAEINGQGGVINAYDSAGQTVGADVIARLSAQGITSKGATVHTQMLRDRTTGEIYYQRVQGGQAQLVSPKGQVFSGDTKNLYAYGIGSDLETKNAIQLQTLRNDLLNKPKIAAAEKLAEFNAMNGTNYTVDQVLSSAPALQVGAPGEAPSAAVQARAAGIPVISGTRSNDEQWALYDKWVESGRKGNPVARPGTSRHETGEAIDVNSAKLTPENRTWLKDNNYVQPLPQKDPNHYERTGVNAPPTAIAAIPSQAPLPQPGESPNVFAGRLKAWEKENEKTTGAELAKVQNAKAVYDVIKEINTALPNATGSGIGDRIDSVYRFFGKTNEGMKATSQLQVLGDRLLKSVPRFEGPQSDRDVQSYKDAAADLANPRRTNEERMAAFKTIQDLNKKYLPGVDWDFKGAAGSGIKIIKREKIS